MSSTKLSFIVPIFNKSQHILEKCIKSLIDQSLKSWELIAVLDGPDEDARRIINRLMKKVPNRFKVITIPHRGAPAARNAGFIVSSGENVVFWDADCLIEPHAAKAWIDLFDSKPEIGFIYSGYKFLNEAGAINSEPFDPWTLRVRNYISGCFPLRRVLVPKWNESLQSLQDWDFWLSVIEAGGIGHFQQGYAFSTELPTEDSISGKGCGPDVWLERVNAVKKLHNLPERDICVSSLSYKPDGIALAKLLDADYQDFPNHKPHTYKKIIQVGFSLKPDMVQAHAAIFGNPATKNYLFWMPDNIHEAWNEMSFNALNKYGLLLNNCATQFVEDKTAKDLMEKVGFKTVVLPMPMRNTSEIKPLPEKPRFAVDIDPGYGKIFTLLDQSLPDLTLDILDGTKAINDYTGLIHFFGDKTLSNGIKRALMTGRHVISNVQDPFTGFIDDNTDPEQFITSFIEHIRKVAKKPLNHNATEYWKNELNPQKLVEALA